MAVDPLAVRGLSSDVALPRLGVDSRETIGYPIVPVGDATKGRRDGSKVSCVAYPGIDWEIAYPTPKDGGRLPSSAVLDVYTGLLFLWASQGYPPDGRVRFRRHHFLHLIGWVCAANGRRARPAGRQYEQLEEAIRYLAQTHFSRGGDGVTQLDLDGQSFQGVLGFNIIDNWKLAEEKRGRKPVEGEGEAQSEVQFTVGFRKMVAGGRRASHLDLDLYLSLPAGTPRMLFRLLVWMRQEGITRLPIGEVLERIGSVQHHHVPARARQVLNKAHDVLVSTGILASEPEFEKDGDTWCLVYHMGEPTVLLAEELVLVQQAMAYGVSQAVARQLAVGYRQDLERVLGAAALGLLRPKKNLAGLIVQFVKNSWRIPEQPTEPSTSQVEMDLVSETAYLRWCVEERERRLRRSSVDLAELRSGIRTRVARRSGEPHWLGEGMLAIALNQQLEIEDLDEWRASQLFA